MANRWERAVTHTVRIRQGVKVAVRHWCKELGTVERYFRLIKRRGVPDCFRHYSNKGQQIDEQLPTQRTT